jgi:hypothetical protein
MADMELVRQYAQWAENELQVGLSEPDDARARLYTARAQVYATIAVAFSGGGDE